MDRSERDRFAARTDQTNLAYAESACLETPPDVFKVLDDEFHFDIDLTANERNHLLPRWFGPGSLHPDALATTWYHVATVAQAAGENPWLHSTTVGFSNPPYGKVLEAILAKAILEMKTGFTSVFLLPMRASWWYLKLVLPFADEVRHTPRITFWYQGQPRKTARDKKTGELKPAGAMFDSIIVVYRPYPKFRHHCCPHFSEWDWRTARVPTDRPPQPVREEEPPLPLEAD